MMLPLFIWTGKSTWTPPITWLIAYWKFANWADTTEYTWTYNLTKTWTPTIWTDRLWNSAWFSWFSTANYFSHPTFLDAWLTARTCFVWFKATGTTRQFMIDKESSWLSYPFELLTDSNWKITLYLTTVYWINVYQSTSTVNSWNWVFAVISWDSSWRASISMNINWWSAEWSLTNSSWTNSWAIVADTSKDFNIWNRWDNTEAYINWSIWEVWFCNRVLTTAEKLRLYTDSASQYIVPNILTT